MRRFLFVLGLAYVSVTIHLLYLSDRQIWQAVWALKDHTITVALPFSLLILVVCLIGYFFETLCYRLFSQRFKIAVWARTLTHYLLSIATYYLFFHLLMVIIAAN